jgi:hypothetical protein
MLETSGGLALGLMCRYNVYSTLGQEMERIGWILMYVLTKYLVSRLVYKGLMANVSERRRPNTANPEDLVRTKYVAGEECQARITRGTEVSDNGYRCLQS